MRRDRAFCLHTGVIVAVLLGGPMIAFAQTGGALNSPPGAETTAPQQPDKGLSGSSGGSLSRELNRSGGVIHPPANVDPGLSHPAPEIGAQSMPVISPPGTPGGNPDIKPK